MQRAVDVLRDIDALRDGDAPSAHRDGDASSALRAIDAKVRIVTAAIAIPDDVRAQIYAHARATFPDECCGYLVGPRGGDAVNAAVVCRNAQLDGEHPTVPERGADTGFVIAGAELLAFARAFDGESPPRVVYHSHTNGRAYFSSVDRDVAAQSYPVQHLVVGVTADRVTEAAQFAWSDDARDFVELARWRVAP